MTAWWILQLPGRMWNRVVSSIASVALIAAIAAIATITVVIVLVDLLIVVVAHAAAGVLDTRIRLLYNPSHICFTVRDRHMLSLQFCSIQVKNHKSTSLLYDRQTAIELHSTIIQSIATNHGSKMAPAQMLDRVATKKPATHQPLGDVSKSEPLAQFRVLCRQAT
jgi:hypothetical protein